MVDSLINSSRLSLNAVQRIAHKALTFVEADVRDAQALAKVFRTNRIDAVMHFAGLKAVGDSVSAPLRYYDANVVGAIYLLEAMMAADVKILVFSSSATVYGLGGSEPLTEAAPTSAASPYGQTKLIIERLLADLFGADPTWGISILRYFNPVGAHESGELGEDPNGTPNNLLPYVTQVAVGRYPEVRVFGDDYPTRDGTGVRDYIHIVDLVRGHLRALEYLRRSPTLSTHNLGTGRGYSVFEVIGALRNIVGRDIPFTIGPRREGDVATSIADPGKAATELNWVAEYDLSRMCKDAWRWQSSHPYGYQR